MPFCCGCGVCSPCRQGETQLCERDFQPGFTAWGSFAEFVALPRADLNLVAVPAGLSDVEAASLGCRFMTAWAALHVHAGVRAGEWVAVHGCGGVGLAAVMIAAAAGARVVAVDIDEAKLERAVSFGAEAAVSADVVEAIRSLSGGGADVSLDALGSPSTCVNSVECLRWRGRHAQVGLLLGDASAVELPMARVIARELRIFGVHGMAVRHYDAHALGDRRRLAASGRAGGQDDRARWMRARSWRRWGGSRRKGSRSSCREAALPTPPVRRNAPPWPHAHHSAAASASTSVVSRTLCRSTHSSGACRLPPIGP